MPNYFLKELFTPKPQSEEAILRKNIQWALGELNAARQNFDMVTGAQNVELAIFELNAAERRYQNLMSQAKGFLSGGTADGITG